MEYLKPSFSVDLGSKKYQDHFDCVFRGKKCEECAAYEEAAAYLGGRVLSDAEVDTLLEQNRLGRNEASRSMVRRLAAQRGRK